MCKSEGPCCLRFAGLSTNIFQAIAFFIDIDALMFVRIKKELNLQIQDELAERRKSYE